MDPFPEAVNVTRASWCPIRKKSRQIRTVHDARAIDVGNFVRGVPASKQDPRGGSEACILWGLAHNRRAPSLVRCTLERCLTSGLPPLARAARTPADPAAQGD